MIIVIIIIFNVDIYASFGSHNVYNCKTSGGHTRLSSSKESHRVSQSQAPPSLTTTSIIQFHIQRDAKSGIYGYLQMIIVCLYNSLYVLSKYSYIEIFVACCVTKAPCSAIIFNLSQTIQTLEWHAILL